MARKPKLSDAGRSEARLLWAVVQNLELAGLSVDEVAERIDRFAKKLGWVKPWLIPAGTTGDEGIAHVEAELLAFAIGAREEMERRLAAAIAEVKEYTAALGALPQHCHAAKNAAGKRRAKKAARR